MHRVDRNTGRVPNVPEVPVRFLLAGCPATELAPPFAPILISHDGKSRFLRRPTDLIPVKAATGEFERLSEKNCARLRKGVEIEIHFQYCPTDHWNMMRHGGAVERRTGTGPAASTNRKTKEMP
jgi:hypothetical protein